MNFLVHVRAVVQIILVGLLRVWENELIKSQETETGWKLGANLIQCLALVAELVEVGCDGGFNQEANVWIVDIIVIVISIIVFII